MSMKLNPSPDQSLLHEYFDYKDGKLYWKDREDVPAWWNTRYAGKRAGGLTTHGFQYVLVNKVGHMEHRLVWSYFFGPIPEGNQVGHKDNVKLNNNIDNLLCYAETSRVLLKGNKPKKTARIAVRGVSKVGERFRVEFQFGGKRHNGGCWDTLDEAEKAYAEIKNKVISQLEDIF